MMNWANVLTGTRLVLIIPVTIALLSGHTRVALSLYVLAAITDFFDGKVARKYNFASEFGARFDATVDMILVAAVFLWSALIGSIHVLWLLAIILLTHGLTAVLSLRRHKKILAPHLPLGKVGTAALFIAFPVGLVFGGMAQWLILATAIIVMGRIEATVYILKKPF